VSGTVLILRPEPGASATAARAWAFGMSPILAPLFAIRTLPWDAPDPADYDAVLLTSANGARHAGARLRNFTDLPCYAVGEASAAAARQAGFEEVRTGSADGAAALAMLSADGVRRALHPCGLAHTGLAGLGPEIVHRPVYAADPVDSLPRAAAKAIADGALVLLHSPRAGALLARLVRDREAVRIAAISAAAAGAAGPGWRSKAVAEAPRDEALLELALKLCQTGGPGSGADA